MQDQLFLSKAPSDVNIIHAKGLQLKHPAIGMATQHSCGHDTAETLSAWQQNVLSTFTPCRLPAFLDSPWGTGCFLWIRHRGPQINQCCLHPRNILRTLMTVLGHAPLGTFHALGKRQALYVRAPPRKGCPPAAEPAEQQLWTTPQSKLLFPKPKLSSACYCQSFWTLVLGCTCTITRGHSHPGTPADTG